MSFLYIGKGLTPEEFAVYVNQYNIGSIPPSFLVFHHTYIPSASWDRTNTGRDWDANEQGLNTGQVYNKRRVQLNGIRNYYRDSLKWDRGPHLFIDEKWVWLFTPLYYQGIHAGPANGYWKGGKYYYSIGIEVIGNYSQVEWPESVQRNVSVVSKALYHKCKAWKPVYGKGPGFISSHRDYMHTSCTGNAIRNEFIEHVVAKGIYCG